jgi:hypothetical protein
MHYGRQQKSFAKEVNERGMLQKQERNAVGRVDAAALFGRSVGPEPHALLFLALS